MAKQGMRRPIHHNGHKTEMDTVPEIQGKAKTGNAKAGSVNAPNWARDDYKSGQ